MKATIQGVILTVTALIGQTFGQFGGGLGTAENPYLIYDATQLNQIGGSPQFLSAHFKLMDNIDLSSLGEQEFNLIGRMLYNAEYNYYYPQAFTGGFDGNGFSIRHFTYIAPNEPYISFFGYIESYDPDEPVVIKNLTLENVSVDGQNVAAGLAAHIGGNCIIENCHVTGSVSVSEYNNPEVWDNTCGGVIGYASGTVDIINASFAGDIQVFNAGQSLFSIGGLAGYAGTASHVMDCRAAAEITAPQGTIGGLIGETYLYNGGSITGGIADCDIYCPGNGTAGGLVGNHYGDETTILSGCYALGRVENYGEYAGGLIGACRGRVTACFADAEVYGSGIFSSAGGLVGILFSDSNISECGAMAYVEGHWDVGGFLGIAAMDGMSEIHDCYAHGEAAGLGSLAVCGGFAGTVYDKNLVENCYSTNAVTGTGYLSGFARVAQRSYILNCFWDMDSSGIDRNAYVTGLTTAAAKTLSPFSTAGWDFAGVWAMYEGMNYPELRVFWNDGDFFQPNGVDYLDYAYFCECWTQNTQSLPGCSAADMDTSGIVDLGDMVIFCRNWCSH